MRQDSAFINGQIILSDEKPVSIRFAVVDYLLGVEKYEYATIDDEGRFQIKFFIRNTHQVYCSYGEKRRRYNMLILSPGDSLTLSVNNDDVKFFGKNARASENYYQLRSPKEWSTYYYALDTGYRLEPEAYLEFRNNHYKMDIQFLASYCKTNDCSALFKQWYTADAKVRNFRDLLAYSWKSRDYGLGSEVRLTGERKEKYNAAYLSDIDLDDSTYTISKWHTFFLSGYSQKVEKTIPFDQVQKVLYITKLNFLLDIISKEVWLEVNESSANKKVLQNLLKRAHEDSEPDSADLKIMWRLAEHYELPLQRAMDVWNADRWVGEINSISHQNTRELRFLHTFVENIEQIPYVDYIYEKMYSNIQNPTYRDLLTREYEKKKAEDALVSNPEGITVMPNKYRESADNLLSTIVKSNPNKVIVIDFWATWCAPCLDDFTQMKPIKEKLPADSISYVYLCSQSSRDLWLKQLRKHGVKGQHYFLSDTQYSEFQKKFGLKAFPSYVIVDAKRRIHKDINLRDIREEKRFLEKLHGIMARDN
jgi:thiol-disulfide isomerase/thioredoxin